MKITNVSVDVNSQLEIRQQKNSKFDNVKAEVHAATQVEAKEKEEEGQKGRKAKRV